MTTTVGFIGLGVMGRGMARNLIDAGFAFAVTTRDATKAETFAKLGASVEADPRAVAEKTSVIVSCLPDARALKDVLLGERGVAGAPWPGGLLIECSTIAPFESQMFAEALGKVGATMIDAPVSGGRKGAEDGTLTIMVGGGDADVERAGPMLEAMGKNIHHVGPLGSGQVFKAANQLMVAVNLMGVCEAIALVRGTGADPRQMREVLSTGAARSGVLDAHAKRYLDGTVEPGFRARLLNKDLGIANAFGKHVGMVQPAAALAQQLVQAMCNAGMQDLDSAALGLLYDRMNGFSEQEGQQ